MISCLIYLLLSISLRLFTIESKAYVIFQTEINSVVIRGVITQVQILISVFIVLKLNKEGYITALILNMFSLMMALVFYSEARLDSLPGVISSIAVIIIITLIMEFKSQVFHYMKN